VGGEIVEILWRKHGETFPSGENMENIDFAMEKNMPRWREYGDYW